VFVLQQPPVPALLRLVGHGLHYGCAVALAVLATSDQESADVRLRVRALVRRPEIVRLGQRDDRDEDLFEYPPRTRYVSHERNGNRVLASATGVPGL
jgi:hypothetical protein